MRIYVTQTLMSVKFPLLNCIVRITIGFFFSTQKLFLPFQMNMHQNVGLFNFKELAPLNSRRTQNFPCMSLYIILECTVLYPVTLSHCRQDISIRSPVFHSVGPARMIISLKMKYTFGFFFTIIDNKNNDSQ